MKRKLIMKALRLILSAMAVIFLGALTVCTTRAQSYSIGWFAIEGGGGTSTGGVFSVTGTIGQPDAGAAMSGGAFSVVGGFWSIFAVQTPGAPLLSIIRSGNIASISWPLPATDFVLDQTTTLTGGPAPWSQVPFPYITNASTISITLPAGTGNSYYRLRKP
jgi:hypothetical protein